MSPTAVAETAAAHAEALTNSQEVYRAVLEEALPVNVLDTPESFQHPEREEFYNVVERTPLVRSHYNLGGHYGLNKDERVQRSGAYKTRGMTRAAQCLKRDGLPSVGLNIASAGNAAGGLVDAGEAFGFPVTVECVTEASPAKVGPLRERGAKVNNVHPTIERALDTSRTKGGERGAVHPFDQVEVIAGQATIGFEMVADLLAAAERGELDLHRNPIKLFVPVGGGGLIAGVACAVRWAKDKGLLGEGNVQVVGVQMEGCDAVNRARRYVRAGLPVPEDLFARGEGPDFNPAADGTAVRKPGELTLAIVADERFVQDMLVVSEGELGEAMAICRGEPAGALSCAGARAYAAQHPTGRYRQSAEVLATITSGGNASEATRQHFRLAAAKLRAERQARYEAETARQRQYLADLALNGKSVDLTHVGKAKAVTPLRRGLHVISRPFVGTAA